GHTPAEVGPKMDGADILNIHGRAILGFERDIFDVFNAFDVAASAHVVFGGSDFKDFAAHVAVGHSNFADDFVKWDAVGEQLVRVHIHLILLNEAANRGDFGHAFHGFEGVAEMPVLERAQFSEV